ncbi:MAG: hypothetical protein HYY37_02675 [Candidatus Aenigmarchaeota archaeon]|nr:hypothetical protein [Candidatus Aenigmarchaeota archaeon]
MPKNTRDVAKHETGHLLGYTTHHDGPVTDVRGYPAEQRCNMLFTVPAAYTCRKCSDALVAFWQGMEYKTGERYLTAPKTGRLARLMQRCKGYGR